MAGLRGAREEGFTLIELHVVVLVIGILAAIAIPNYIGQQKEAKDSAAMAQLRTAATTQDLYHAKQDAFADTATALEAYGFRQGGQWVTVVTANANTYYASTYCTQAPAAPTPSR
jgi:type IV pilus assembly protein PilA